MSLRVQSAACCQLHHRAVELEGVEPSGRILQGWPDAHIPTPKDRCGVSPLSPLGLTVRASILIADDEARGGSTPATSPPGTSCTFGLALIRRVL